MFLHSICFNSCVCFTVYWLAGAETCFILSSAAFVIPLALLSTANRLKVDWTNNNSKTLESAQPMLTSRETVMMETFMVLFFLFCFIWKLCCLHLLGKQALIIGRCLISTLFVTDPHVKQNHEKRQCTCQNCFHCECLFLLIINQIYTCGIYSVSVYTAIFYQPFS